MMIKNQLWRNDKYAAPIAEEVELAPTAYYLLEGTGVGGDWEDTGDD
jgi:hypothetical protein